MWNRWSYDTRGKLIKAPEFENVPDFDKSQNSLWEVKLEIRDGLVFINMESIENSQNSELSTSATVMTNPKTQNLKCAVEWKIDGRFNWKLAGKLRTLLSLAYNSLLTILSRHVIFSKPEWDNILVKSLSFWPSQRKLRVHSSHRQTNFRSSSNPSISAQIGNDNNYRVCFIQV